MIRIKFGPGGLAKPSPPPTPVHLRGRNKIATDRRRDVGLEVGVFNERMTGAQGMVLITVLQPHVFAFKTELMEFSPNLAETGTRFLRGTRRSLHVFSSGNSHFMWRLKFSLRIERITLTMLVLLSLSLGKEKKENAACTVRSASWWAFLRNTVLASSPSHLRS